MPVIRGLEAKHEQKPQQLLRDTRTLGMRFVDFFQDPLNSAVCMAGFAIAAYIFPLIADIILVLGIGIFIFAFTRKSTLPFRMPVRSDEYDHNDINPGSKKANKARGIYFFGNRLSNNEELWFNNDDMRTHVLIFGSTGSGKTEALISISYNALLQGSGFIYVDGKGDNTLFSKIYAMAKGMGRLDDLLLINFMTGARDVVGAQEKRLSNTMNPFCQGSSGMLSQLVVSLMDASSQSPDGDMWKGRAIAFVEALMRILVYMRDQDKILLDANTIRNYFHLERIEAMVVDKLFVRDNEEPVSLTDAPSVVLEPVANYLATLPGYDKSKKGKQSSQTLEQHGFITMQLTRVFSSLADTYGHIIRTNLAEVDVKDVVLNRRILVVLLPALEKSPEELSNLGKVIVASLKAMMAAGLGEAVEGTYTEVISRKPTNAPTPYLCVLDEYGYYAVKGFAVVPAQARSLGFSVVFAGQDLPAFQKASKEEAMSIGANTNIKICMKLEDPLETWDFFMKTAGESYVTKVDSFQTQADSVLNNYMDSRSASSEKRARVDLLDLKDQSPGEYHIFFQSKLIRARSFFANPPAVERMRLNHFLKVEPPKGRALLDLQERLQTFKNILDASDDPFAGIDDESKEIKIVSESMTNHEPENLIERGVTALLAFHNYQNAPSPDFEEQETIFEEEVDEGRLNIFIKPRLSDLTEKLIGPMDIDAFASVLVAKNFVTTKIELLERLGGKSSPEANMIMKEILRDMENATDYPPEVSDLLSVDELCDITNEITNYVKNLSSSDDDYDEDF